MSNETVRYRGCKIVFWGITKTFNVIHNGLCVHEGTSMANAKAWLDDKIERFGCLPSPSYSRNGWDYLAGWDEE